MKAKIKIDANKLAMLVRELHANMSRESMVCSSTSICVGEFGAYQLLLKITREDDKHDAIHEPNICVREFRRLPKKKAIK